jgi:hypothetical protein
MQKISQEKSVKFTPSIQQLDALDSQKIYISSRITDFASIVNLLLSCVGRNYDERIEDEKAIDDSFLKGFNMQINFECSYLKFSLQFSKDSSKKTTNEQLHLNFHWKNILRKLVHCKKVWIDPVALVKFKIMSDSKIVIDPAKALLGAFFHPSIIDIEMNEIFGCIPVRKLFLHEPLNLKSQKKDVCQQLTDFCIVNQNLDVFLHDMKTESYILQQRSCHKKRAVFANFYGKQLDADDFLYQIRFEKTNLLIEVLISSFESIFSSRVPDKPLIQKIFFNDKIYHASPNIVCKIIALYEKLLSLSFPIQKTNDISFQNITIFVDIKSKAKEFPYKLFFKQIYRILHDKISKYKESHHLHEFSQLENHPEIGAGMKLNDKQLAIGFDFVHNFSTNIQKSWIERRPNRSLDQIIPKDYRNISFSAKDELETSYELHVDRDELRELDVLGQLDKKFIICISKKSQIIYAIDQHAADERVHLEEFENELLTKTNQIIKKVHILDSISHSDQKHKIKFYKLKNFENILDCLRKIGLESSIEENSSSNSNTAYIRVYQTFEILGYKLNQNDLQTFLEQDICSYILSRGNTEEVSGAYMNSKLIHEILCKKACRTAIMFGDELSLTQCTKLISRLLICKLPFQCAHGRPSIVPLLKL